METISRRKTGIRVYDSFYSSLFGLLTRSYKIERCQALIPMGSSLEAVGGFRENSPCLAFVPKFQHLWTMFFVLNVKVAVYNLVRSQGTYIHFTHLTTKTPLSFNPSKTKPLTPLTTNLNPSYNKPHTANQKNPTTVSGTMSRFSLTILPLLLALVLPVLSALLPRAPPPFKVEVIASAVQQPLYFTTNKGTCTPAKAESPICQIKANGQLYCGDYTHPLALNLEAVPGDVLASYLAPCTGACVMVTPVRLNPNTLVVEWPGAEFWYLPSTSQVWIAQAGANVPVEIPAAAVKAQLKALFS
ncbi:hypothetical protein HYALB_00008909 [Hymenoscyphus albidus]|uniref:Uncharacterized protein n=1 Tax=Hymenoscyphus albidus TaxID=595503 RepID=A0A9N9LXJ5_9HELO|nr:hypothetical protein HYALB_00008909 [Hymenoscyphus albidus]